jgi:hypothetical protein
MQQVHCGCQEDQAVDDQDPKPPPDEQSAGAVPEGIGELPKAPISDGRIPPELREWVLAQLGPFDESIYENLDEEEACWNFTSFSTSKNWSAKQPVSKPNANGSGGFFRVTYSGVVQMS